MLRSLMTYKYSCLNDLDTSKLSEKKSVIFKNVTYIFNNGQLIAALGDSTIANDSHALYEALLGKGNHAKAARELFDTEHGLVV